MRQQRPVGQAVWPAGWWFDVLSLGGFAGLTWLLAVGVLLDVDLAVSAWCAAHRVEPVYWAARGLNFLGNGGPLTALCLAVAVVLGVRRRTARPVLPVAAAFLLTGLVIMPIKLWTDRAAPTSPLPDPVELFNTIPPGEYGLGYPSGHLVNAVVWYGVLVLLLRPWLPGAARRWLRIAPPVIVFGTTVYLNFHWLTDSVAGLLLGLLLDRQLTRLPGGAARDPAPAGRT